MSGWNISENDLLFALCVVPVSYTHLDVYKRQYVDQSGTIHLSWVWRETWHVETNHDLCYARSFDGGRTWYKTNGQKYELPIRLGNAEYALSLIHISLNDLRN